MARGKQIAVRLAPTVDYEIRCRWLEHRSMSDMYNEVIDRYVKLCHDNLPQNFTDNEWRCILNATNGADFAGECFDTILGDLANEIKRRLLHQKWKVSYDELIDKLRALTLTQWIALADACEVFWGSDEEKPPLPPNRKPMVI